MIYPTPAPPPLDFAAVRAKRRAAAVKLLRRPGAVLDTTGAVPRVLLPPPGGSNAKEPPPPRPVATGVVRDLMDAGRLRPVPGEPGRYALDVAASGGEPPTEPPEGCLTAAEVAALLACVRAASLRAVAADAGLDRLTLTRAARGVALRADALDRLRSYLYRPAP